MALVVIASAKGAPGVTTLTVALAALTPDAIAADLDPDGGDLALRYRTEDGAPLDPDVGLLSLAASLRRDHTELAGQTGPLAEHLQVASGGLELLLGVTGPDQAVGLGPLWSPLGRALSDTDRTVYADCGRIGPASPAMPVLQQADAVILLARAELEELAHLRERLRFLNAALPARYTGPARVGVILVARERDHAAGPRTEQLLRSSGLAVPVLGTVAEDARGAARVRGLHGGRAGRTTLVRSVRSLLPAVTTLIGFVPAGTADHPSAVNPLDAEPLRLDSIGLDPTGVDPTGVDPIGVDPVPGRPVARAVDRPPPVRDRARPTPDRPDPATPTRPPAARTSVERPPSAPPPVIPWPAPAPTPPSATAQLHSPRPELRPLPPPPTPDTAFGYPSVNQAAGLISPYQAPPEDVAEPAVEPSLEPDLAPDLAPDDDWIEPAPDDDVQDQDAQFQAAQFHAAQFQDPQRHELSAENLRGEGDEGGPEPAPTQPTWAGRGFAALATGPVPTTDPGPDVDNATGGAFSPDDAADEVFGPDHPPADDFTDVAVHDVPPSDELPPTDDVLAPDDLRPTENVRSADDVRPTDDVTVNVTVDDDRTHRTDPNHQQDRTDEPADQPAPAQNGWPGTGSGTLSGVTATVLQNWGH